MKKLLTSSLLVCFTLTTFAPSAQAMEIAAIVVGGSVSTIALSGTAAVLGHAQFKTEAYHEAMDVVAAGDLSMMTPAVAKIIKDLKAANPNVRAMNDLALLEAVLNADIISE